MSEMINDEELVRMSLEARKNSYSPYSKYRVGAALLCDDGSVYTGCNVENASYPCGICAERNAMAAAVAGGHRKFSKIAISGSSEAVCTPCGMCRQFMYEFSPNLTVLCAGSGGDFVSKSLKDLLVDGFGPENM